ncbi:MAG: AhpC/TSA family protein [Bacteroidales bacterium]|nr:AhpC/TSA family protein [Bacteroidales bacterium]
MMNKVALLCCLLFFTACNQNKVSITGKIDNAGEAVLHLDEVDVYNTVPLDSVVLKPNGKFSFTFAADMPGFYQLRLSTGKVIVLFPKPGEDIVVETDANKLYPALKISGSHDTEQITKLIILLNQTTARLDSISKLYTQATDDTLKSSLNKEYQEVLEAHRRASMAYILTHSNSLSSLYAIYQQYFPGNYVFYKTSDIQFFKILSDSLSKYYPESHHVAALKANSKKMLSDYQTMVLMESAGQVEGLPDIALPATNGDTVSLRSLNDKYILLSFWSMTNQQCVTENLQLKNVYKQFSSKGFEIYQVSFDQSADAWLKAVRFDELPWVSVINEGNQNSMVAGTYNVNQLPANYLIDNTRQTIVGKNLSPAQLQDKLNELLR